MKTNPQIALLAVMLAAVNPALAVVTNVAPSGVIIQSGGSFNTYMVPSLVIDGRTNEAPNESPTFWVGSAGKSTGYFILDLLNDYPVSSVVLYNTHGGAAENDGTANFAVSVSDTLGPNTVTLDRYYKFNGDLNDSSGNGVDAVEVDSSLTPTTPVFSNSVPAVLTNFTQSLSFSGYGESVEIANPTGMAQPTAFSYSMWVMCQTLYFGSLQPTSFIVRTAAAGHENNTWSHQIRLNTALNFEAYTFDGAQKTVTGTTVVQPDVWYHVAVTAQNGGLEHLYVNGVEEGTPAAVGTLWQGGGMIEIGTGSGGGFSPSSELISDVGIWFSVLTPAAVLSLSKGASPLSVGAASGVTLINPTAVVSGTLTNVTGQTNITPAVYKLSNPVTARYWRFDALSCAYPISSNNSIGLDEFQLFADVPMPTITVKPAIELTWPVNPFPLLSSRTLPSTNWVPVEPPPVFNGNAFVFSGVPTLTGTNFSFFQAADDSADFFALARTAPGQTVSTNVARSGNIIWASSYYTGPTFPPYAVIDGITYESTNVCAIQPPPYWLAVNSDTNASFVLDLQREYSISSVNLYNTHNGSCNDRGTAQFDLSAVDGVIITTNATVEASPVDRYYPLDGDTTDHSTNKVDAAFLDAASPGGNPVTPTFSTDVPAVLKSGHSLVLSGNGDRLEILDPFGMTEPTVYSLSFWVNLSDLSLASSIIVRTDPNGETNDYSHEVRVLPSGQFESWLCCISGPIDGTTLAQPGVWYHVAVTAQEGDYEHLYINGKEEGTPLPVGLGAMWKGGDRWTIGTGCGGGAAGITVPGFAPLLGEVTNVAIWFSVITPDEIQALAAGTRPTAINGGSAPTTTATFPNPRPVASGTLSDMAGVDQIVPDVFEVTPPVTARYLKFTALSGIYPSGYEGLNEIEVYSTIEAAKQSISRALLLTWPYSPFNVVLQSSPDMTTWTTVSAQPDLVGTTWQVFQPIAGQALLSAQHTLIRGPWAALPRPYRPGQGLARIWRLTSSEPEHLAQLPKVLPRQARSAGGRGAKATLQPSLCTVAEAATVQVGIRGADLWSAGSRSLRLRVPCGCDARGQRPLQPADQRSAPRLIRYLRRLVTGAWPRTPAIGELCRGLCRSLCRFDHFSTKVFDKGCDKGSEPGLVTPDIQL